MVNLTLPAYRSDRNLTEQDIEKMSKEECLALRRDIQAELARWAKVNPGILSRFLNRVNERLFAENYYGGYDLADAHEG